MAKDTNWGVAILIVMCVYSLLNFFYDEVRFNRLQSEIRDRVDGRVSIVVHQIEDIKALINNQCSTKE